MMKKQKNKKQPKHKKNLKQKKNNQNFFDRDKQIITNC